MRTMCSPPAVNAPNASVSATSPSANDASERSITCLTAATDAGGIDADAGGEIADDRVELRTWVHGVEPADAHRLVGTDVATREDQLQRASAAQQMGKPRGAAGAGEDPHRHLGLAEHRTLAPVAEVEGGEELGTATARRAVDDPDRHEAAAVQALEQRGRHVGLGRGLVRAGRDGQDAVHVAVHEEEVGIGAREHDHAHAVVGLEPVEQSAAARR